VTTPISPTSGVPIICSVLFKRGAVKVVKAFHWFGKTTKAFSFYYYLPFLEKQEQQTRSIKSNDNKSKQNKLEIEQIKLKQKL